jgi:hypothetical protein
VVQTKRLLVRLFLFLVTLSTLSFLLEDGRTNERLIDWCPRSVVARKQTHQSASQHRAGVGCITNSVRTVSGRNVGQNASFPYGSFEFSLSREREREDCEKREFPAGPHVLADCLLLVLPLSLSKSSLSLLSSLSLSLSLSLSTYL